jgi:hypothetical protein
MQFTIPQFIEHQPKIIGPLTIKQFIFVGGAGALLFILYFLFGKTHFLPFIVITLIVGTLAFGLAFLKINEKSLPAVLMNVFSFSLGSKIYLWRRKEARIKMIKLTHKIEEKKKEDGPNLNFAGKSRLKRLSNQIEI